MRPDANSGLSQVEPVSNRRCADLPGVRQKNRTCPRWTGPATNHRQGQPATLEGLQRRRTVAEPLACGKQENLLSIAGFRKCPGSIGGSVGAETAVRTAGRRPRSGLPDGVRVGCEETIDRSQ